MMAHSHFHSSAASIWLHLKSQYAAFSHAFFQSTIRLFQRDRDLNIIVLSNAEAREQAIRHCFNLVLREVPKGRNV